MIQKVSELKEPPVVGKFYLVECALFYGEWIPIVGDVHADKEIGIEYEHYHKDIRFLPQRLFNGSPRDGVKLFGRPAAELNRSIPPALVVTTELRRRKCLRTMPDCPNWKLLGETPARMVTTLHKIYVGRKVLCGKCPHKGMPLGSLPKDENGHVICNGHGLKIDTNKGEVIAR